MEVNALPTYDMTDNPTGCCPRFDPREWDDQELHFREKLFVRSKTRSLFHIPLNMGSVFEKTFAAIESADAHSDDDFIVLSHDPSAWSGEHYFSVIKEVPDQEMVRLSGNYLTKVFEGPYREVPSWRQKMEAHVNGQGKAVKTTHFFYTTCPKCAKYYGKNYVVAVAETA
ncbi:MAG: hypothetical protein OEQ25_12375 [Gammaproteobacteria bacterium]|nr:hypothetical protein [Gammaproteobacteria bacterium]MDH3507924.1 hypothetical protein [Gammaproteobacteria bacterium]